MVILFTPHAEDKLRRLSKLGVDKKKVVKAVENPEKVETGYFGRKVAQTSLTNDLVLRIVFEERNNNIVIVTIYPGEKARYL